MANYLSIKIGAFIEVPDIQEKVKSKVLICANADCSLFEKETKAAWCHKCGSYIKSVEKTEQINRQYFWFQEDMEIDDYRFNVIQGETSSYLFSNDDDATGIDPIEDVEDRLPLVLAPDFTNDATKEFAMKYASEIDKLEAFYKRRFGVQFGVIKYYS
jgi:hypothetical protein